MSNFSNVMDLNQLYNQLKLLTNDSRGSDPLDCIARTKQFARSIPSGPANHISTISWMVYGVDVEVVRKEPSAVKPNQNMTSRHAALMLEAFEKSGSRFRGEHFILDDTVLQWQIPDALKSQPPSSQQKWLTDNGKLANRNALLIRGPIRQAVEQQYLQGLMQYAFVKSAKIVCVDDSPLTYWL